MHSEFVSDKQKSLFDEIANSGELIFACGSDSVSANIVGQFYVKHYPDRKEHRLEMGDGTNHVHIDWKKVNYAEHAVFHGEGMLSFKDGDKTLFRLYRMDGEFPDEVKNNMGLLI